METFMTKISLSRRSLIAAAQQTGSPARRNGGG